MKLPITIAYITVDDPRDRRTWSGINSFLLRALERRVQRVITIGPLRPQPVLFFSRVLNKLLLLFSGKRFNYRDSFRLSRSYARIIERRLEGVDLIVAPAGLATTASLRTNVPIIHINDRCLAGALDYHRILRDLAAFSRREGLALERATLENATLTVYSSEWAAGGAVQQYADLAEKIRMIPFGANLEEAPAPPDARSFPPAKLKLLMLGVNWEDKGGPIAYQALQAVKSAGVPAELVVCGCTPPAEFNDPDLLREGFLNKNKPEELAKLVHHLRTADFLILPTRFEAYGIVFCEAAAYGLPVLATRTGGIPTIVQEGRTGFLFDLEDDGSAYAKRILELVNDPARWQAMRRAARERYDGTLTWDAFVDALLREAQEAGAISNAR